MEKNDVIEVTNRLIRLDLDALRAYREAVDACIVAEIRSKMTEFMRDHERHVRELEATLVGLGGRPDEHRDVRGFFMEGFASVASRGDRSALLAMRVDEEIANRVYRSALDAELPTDLYEIVARNYEDERRHLGWIKESLRARAWEPKAA